MKAFMLLIFSSFHSRKSAENAAKFLIEKRLAACATILPASSIYLWEGKMKNEDEFVLELKAKKENYKKIEKLLLRLHPYKLPAIYAIEVKHAYGKFENWITKSRGNLDIQIQ